jgi:hypothetical protein
MSGLVSVAAPELRAADTPHHFITITAIAAAAAAVDADATERPTSRLHCSSPQIRTLPLVDFDSFAASAGIKRVIASAHRRHHFTQS